MMVNGHMLIVDDEVNKYNQHNFYMITTDELFKKDKEEHDFNVSDYLELN